MPVRILLNRIIGKYRRTVSSRAYRRMVEIKLSQPIISFTFDDAPQSAFSIGGNILKTYGARGTYFVSLGMLGKNSPAGKIASQDDLFHAIEEGHELGCHTFDHNAPWETPTPLFLESIFKNRQALEKILPRTSFSSFAYPFARPRPATKQRVGMLFNCCRAGGQIFNAGKADLNLLKAFFLDLRNGESIDKMKQVIDKNGEKLGWLIFATHDVTDNPSRYGCRKDIFETLVAYAAASNALILPVVHAYERLKTATTE